MLLPPPNLLYEHVFALAHPPGTGASEQVFIGQVPEEGCCSAVPVPANCRRPTGASCFTRELGMTRPTVSLLQGHGEEVTAMSTLLRNDCYLLA